MSDDSFHVSLGRHLMSSAVFRARPIWRGLGNAESGMIRKQLDGVRIDRPIYVSGLARSGTSVLIEMLASHVQVATHQYRDFPFLFIPFWWRQTLDRSAPAELQPEERAHGDRLMVTANSPEAMEEPLWMAYFKTLHDPHVRNVLDANTSCPSFETFYRDHLKKLLLISNRTRYAAKGNYNLTRLEYILKLFPDARFVVPIRRPREHIASLMKQHALFNAAAARQPRSIKHLDRVGHFEFGMHRRCINVDGGTDAIESVESLWKSGEAVRGWARYWAGLYGWILGRLRMNDTLRNATCFLRYEDLCDQPRESTGRILEHCQLPDEQGELTTRWASMLSRPEYYQATFTPEQERAIGEETGAVASAVGYSV